MSACLPVTFVGSVIMHGKERTSSTSKKNAGDCAFRSQTDSPASHAKCLNINKQQQRQQLLLLIQQCHRTGYVTPFMMIRYQKRDSSLYGLPDMCFRVTRVVQD